LNATHFHLHHFNQLWFHDLLTFLTQDCESLSSIIFQLHSRLTRIESHAFAYSSLELIVIRSTVESIDGSRFYTAALSNYLIESSWFAEREQWMSNRLEVAGRKWKWNGFKWIRLDRPSRMYDHDYREYSRDDLSFTSHIRSHVPPNAWSGGVSSGGI
jgi:hypothetical protein